MLIIFDYRFGHSHPWLPRVQKLHEVTNVLVKIEDLGSQVQKWPQDIYFPLKIKDLGSQVQKWL